MVKDIIEIAIRNHRPLEILYSKDGEKTKTFSLKYVEYSPEYENKCIKAYCEEYRSELTFRIDRIIQANIDWIDVFPPKSSVNQDGLYLVTCRSDMHLEFELRQYKKGDNIVDSYKNSDGIVSSYCQDDLLAYHFIPYYTDDNNNKWNRFEINNEERKKGYYTFAYNQTGDEPQEDKEYDWVDDYDNWMKSKDFLSPWELTNIKAKGISYTVDFIGVSFDKLRIPSNIKVLAYHYCSDYTEVDHANHWDIARELGIVK